MLTDWGRGGAISSYVATLEGQPLMVGGISTKMSRFPKGRSSVKLGRELAGKSLHGKTGKKSTSLMSGGLKKGLIVDR